MAQPHYQIFVSSTFQDLEKEREAVLNAILKLNQFPAGMELFPATNDTAWKHIEKVVKDSDYYVLIIGGKYGSIEKGSGVSYTEKEYDFAISQNIPVLAFTYSDEESIPYGKIEKNKGAREKLKKFKQKVGSKHHWNHWKTLDELKAGVISSLSQAFESFPQRGWVKSIDTEKIELQDKYDKLEKQFSNSQKEIKKLRHSLSNTENFKLLSQADDRIIIEIRSYPENEETDVSWNELFSAIGHNLMKTAKIHHYDMKGIIEDYILTKTIAEREYSPYTRPFKNEIYESTIEQITHQFIALDFVRISFDRNGHHFWNLTDKGRKYFALQNALYAESDK